MFFEHEEEFEYRDAVFCKGNEVVPFFTELAKEGFVWNSGSELLRKDMTPTVINSTNDDIGYVFYMKYDKKITYSAAKDLSDAIFCDDGRTENGVVLFNEFMSTACYADAEVDVMSVL